MQVVGRFLELEDAEGIPLAVVSLDRLVAAVVEDDGSLEVFVEGVQHPLRAGGGIRRLVEALRRAEEERHGR